MMNYKKPYEIIGEKIGGKGGREPFVQTGTLPLPNTCFEEIINSFVQYINVVSLS
jgi:hypothetical protein